MKKSQIFLNQDKNFVLNKINVPLFSLYSENIKNVVVFCGPEKIIYSYIINAVCVDS